jgi:bifunctional ADP-heptose synthase (sugar kinase/adenylyltransferase)
MLRSARSRSDVLVVAIAGECAADKGEGRCVPCSATDRARLVASLEAVDYVTIDNDGPTEDVARVVKPGDLLERVVRGNELSI